MQKQLEKPKKKNFNNQTSRVKLVVYDNANNGKTFYSFAADDKKGYEYTLKAMKERILRKMYRQKFKKAIFYNNTSESVLEKISPTQFEQKYGKSKIKLLVYDSTNQRREFFPNQLESDQPVEFILGSMSARILQIEFRNRFNAAMFYDLETGEELIKVSAYGVTAN
jgi:hypothetical protein